MESSKFDVLLLVEERGAWLRVRLEYSADILERGCAERMLGHWQELLRGAARDEGQKIAELGVMSEGERRQVVEEWNRTEFEYAGESLAELLEEGWRGRGKKVAVVEEGRELSYGELEERSGYVAEYL